MIDLVAYTRGLIANIAPYFGAGGILLSVIFWARRVEGKIDVIKDNHLAHVEENTAVIRDNSVKSVALLEVIAGKLDQQ